MKNALVRPAHKTTLFRRTLTSGSAKHVWRWTGFNHGLDLVVEYSSFNLTVKRNMPGQMAW